MKLSTIKNKKIVRIVLSVVFWLLVWQLASVAIQEELFLVGPFAVLKTLFHLAAETSFWQTVGFSFIRIICGFALAILLGIVLALLSAVFPWVRTLLYPVMAVMKATPVASFIILALLWIKSANLSVFISLLMVLPIIYTNTLQGILKVDKNLLEMAKVFHLSLGKKILYIYIPDIMPFFVSACSISLGLCWKSGIAAEVIGLPRGSIGESLYKTKLYLATDELLAWTVVIILISILFERVFLYVLKAIAAQFEGRRSA